MENSGLLRILVSEDKARPGFSHIILAHLSSVIGSDRSGNLAHIRWRHDVSTRISNPTLHQAHVSSTPLRLVQSSVRMLWKFTPIGMIERDIFGISADGQLVAVGILAKPAWTLLALVQMMCLQNPVLCPHTQSFAKHSFTRTTADAPDCHVDGNILRRLLRRKDAVLVLDNMLRDPTVRQSAHESLRHMSPGRREAICIELLHTLEEEAKNSSSAQDGWRRHFVRGTGSTAEDIVRYMATVVESPF